MRAAVDRSGRALPEWYEGNGRDGAYCKWPGVWCEGRDVVGLSLYQRPKQGALSGRLPSGNVLARLPKLRKFEVNGWGVRGRLRRNYAQLSGLQELVLTVDGAGTGIPAAWGGGMQGLQRLVLKYCNLTGPLPPALGKLGALRELNVTLNALWGGLPDAWGSLGGLKTLDVRCAPRPPALSSACVLVCPSASSFQNTFVAPCFLRASTPPP